MVIQRIICVLNIIKTAARELSSTVLFSQTLFFIDIQLTIYVSLLCFVYVIMKMKRENKNEKKFAIN